MKSNRSLEIRLRPASISDAVMLLSWRNDPNTRRASRNGRCIKPAEHQAWLGRMLASDDHLLEVAESDGVPVGVVRADRTSQGWELSWTVAPAARGRALGSVMLKKFVVGLDGDLTAVIRKDNLASARIAARAGLALAGRSSDPDYEVWIRKEK